MNAHDPSLHRRHGLLGWLGFSSHIDEHSGSPTPAVSLPSAITHRLDAIAAFLAHHDLEVTPLTLSAACDYQSGHDPALVRLIDRRVESRRPITQAWLEEALERDGRGKEMAQLNSLMERLHTSIEDFGRTSREARTATNEYSSALQSHVGDLEQVTATGTVISELATIAKVMIKRTQDIEKQMLRSEAQTRVLRKKLEETKQNAERDHLTGLPNRRAFEAHFEAEYRAARAAGEALSVAFCDIDHFKQVNDTHGHDAGDRVLRLVAESLAHISDEHCHVARHGGEEFVVLFRDTSALEAFEKLDRLRGDLAERRLVNRANDRPFGQITFSGGVADVFAYPDRSSALKAADAALYRAKEGGRNRIEFALA
jgi:diguanylate cyclase